jgi:hypothetical protein
MILQLHRPWLTDEPFRFTNDYVSATWTNMVTQNVNKKRMNVPAEWVFLNRLQWGLFGILAQLGATASWRTFWLDFLYEPGEPRPEPFTANELQLAAA